MLAERPWDPYHECDAGVAISLARLWRDQGKVQQVQSLRATAKSAMLPQRSISPLHQDHPKSRRPTMQWNLNLALRVNERPGLCR